LIALVSFLAFTNSAASQERDILHTDPWKRTGNYFEDLARPREPALLRDYSQVFTRDGPSLMVTLGDGTKLCLTDIPEGYEQPRIYGLYGYDPQSEIAEIMVGYSETLESMLIDRATGHHLLLDGVPHISPDGGRWAVVTAGDNSRNIQVAEFKGHGLELVGDDLAFEGDLCKFESWQTNDAFLFTCFRFADSLSREQIAQRDASGTWRISPIGALTSDKSIDWYGTLP
jgi:hypothetical protein